MMDPDVYNNDGIFKDLMMELDDYYHFLDNKYPFLYIDDYDEGEYFKEHFKKQINMIKKRLYRINEGNDDYLGIIRD